MGCPLSPSPPPAGATEGKASPHSRRRARMKGVTHECLGCRFSKINLKNIRKQRKPLSAGIVCCHSKKICCGRSLCSLLRLTQCRLLENKLSDIRPHVIRRPEWSITAFKIVRLRHHIKLLHSMSHKMIMLSGTRQQCSLQYHE